MSFRVQVGALGKRFYIRLFQQVGRISIAPPDMTMIGLIQLPDDVTLSDLRHSIYTVYRVNNDCNSMKLTIINSINFIVDTVKNEGCVVCDYL